MPEPDWKAEREPSSSCGGQQLGGQQLEASSCSDSQRPAPVRPTVGGQQPPVECLGSVCMGSLSVSLSVARMRCTPLGSGQSRRAVDSTNPLACACAVSMSLALVEQSPVVKPHQSVRWAESCRQRIAPQLEAKPCGRLLLLRATGASNS